MSRTILALSTVALLCASSQIALADESGAITGGVGAASPGLLLAVRSARSWVASGARQSETQCPITGAIIAATLITPITTTTINTDQSTTSGARTSLRSRICRGAAPRA